jgi:hypothetical protein
LEDQLEAGSENARHLILSYGNKLYYVSSVNVSLRKEESTQKAIFHALGVVDNKMEDLELEIPKGIYEVLVEYAKANDPELVLALYVEGSEFKWTTISETWLRHYVNERFAKTYVV